MQKIIIANLILEPETRALTNHVGQTIILRPLPYNVFMLLLEQKEQSVSRDQLFSECWQGVVVTDQALTNVISGLRSNLTELQACGITIKTVSKIGYLLTVDDETFSKENDGKLLAELLSSDNKEGKTKTVVIRESLFVKPSLTSLLISLCLLAAIGGVLWNQKRLSTPHFLIKDHYQHFDINNTDFYLLNKTRESMDLDKIKSQLESMELKECNADVYIRMYDSAYEDDVYSLRGYMTAKSNNKNGNYALSQFSFQELPTIIANAVNRAKLICD